MPMTSPLKDSLAKVSVFISGLCIVHCLLTPFLLLLIPTISAFLSRTVESLLVLMLIPLSVLGFFPTWVKHKNGRLLFFYLIGLGTVVLTHYGFHFSEINHLFFHTHAHEHEPVHTVVAHPLLRGELLLMILGSATMAWATWKNNRHTHVCKNPNHKHSH